MVISSDEEEMPPRVVFQTKTALMKGSDKDVVCVGGDIVNVVMFRDVWTGKWLSDAVINCVTRYLMAEHENVYIFTTYFTTKYLCHRPRDASTVDWEGVQREITKNNARLQSASTDMLVVPVHIPMHWLLLVINLKKQQITIYDSLPSSSTRRWKTRLGERFKELVKKIRGGSGVLEVKIEDKGVEQPDAVSCGVLMLQTCKRVVEGISPLYNFDATHVSKWRKEWICGILWNLHKQQTKTLI